MNKVIFTPTLSGQTPHQRVTEYICNILGDEEGKKVCDYAWLIGVEKGTAAYDECIDIICGQLGIDTQNLIDYIQLNGN